MTSKLKLIDASNAGDVKAQRSVGWAKAAEALR
jgi:hypothetical protein